MALTNAQYDLIMRSYEEKQLRNQTVLLQHYNEIYDKIPKVKELENSISFLSVQQAKKLLDGDTNALDTLRTQIGALRQEKAALLKEYGYPEYYLEESYDCPLCKDTGYIGNKKCACFKKATIELLYAQSNLKEILKKENFDTFRLDYYSDNYVDPKTGRSSLPQCAKHLQSADNSQSILVKNLAIYSSTEIRESEKHFSPTVLPRN